MRVLLIIWLQFVLFGGYCQTTKFNILFTDSQRDFRNIVVTDTGYFFLGGIIDTNIKITTCFTNNAGQLIWEKIVGKPNSHVYHGYENCLHAFSDGSGYIIAGSYVTGITDEGILVKFNSVFDTLWLKYYPLDSNYVDFYNCVIDESNNIIVCGGHLDTNNILGTSDALFLKTDSAGNLIYYRDFGSTPGDMFSQIIQDPSRNYVMAGVCWYGSGDWYIVKTDSAANQVWWNHYGTATENDTYVRGLITTQDSGYIFTGVKDILNSKYKGHIIKMRKNMTVEWDKLFLNQSSHSSLMTTIELADKTLISVGSEGTSDGLYDAGCIVKLTKDGDLIWKRNYTATTNIEANDWMLTVKETPDKGFIIAGLNQDPQTHAWIVKTNCLGYVENPIAGFSHSGSISQHSYIYYNQSQNADSCIWDFGDGSPPLYAAVTDTVEHVYSQTGFYTVQLIAYTSCPVQDRDTLQQLILVSIVGYDNISSETGMVTIRPNPAKEKVYISTEREVRNMQLQLFNQQGIIIYQAAMSEKLIEINTQNWQSGVYVVKLISEKGVVVKKLVIE